MTTTVLVAGATGDLGTRIVRELLQRDAAIRVLTRPGSGTARARYAGEASIEVVEADYADPAALAAALQGVEVVVSAVSGTRPVIVDAQRALLAAAVSAGVARFLPSDYSADYRRIALGSNRNFELRREFAAELDAAPIRGTSVLNGAFTDMLTGTAPMISFTGRRVLFWSSADQILDFTSKDDVARVVALAALDADAPRTIEIAGDRVSARDVARTLSGLTGTPFRLQWAGTTGTLAAMAAVGRRLSRDTEEPFPAWQGMQYFVSMFSGQAQAVERHGGAVPRMAGHAVLREHVQRAGAAASRGQRPLRTARVDDRSRRARGAPRKDARGGSLRRLTLANVSDGPPPASLCARAARRYGLRDPEDDPAS